MTDPEIQALRERILNLNAHKLAPGAGIPRLLAEVDVQVLYVLNGAVPAVSEPTASA